MTSNISVHHIGLSKTSLNLSGGEKAEIEIIDYLNKAGLKNIIYTSESGKMLYSRLKKFPHGNFVLIGSFKLENVNPYLAYYLRAVQCLSLIHISEPTRR